MHQRNLGVLDLACTGFAADLAHCFDDMKKTTAEARVPAR